MGEPEVAEFHVEVGVQEDVFGLQVAVHDAARVEVIDGETEFVEHSPFDERHHVFVLAEVGQEVAARAVLHDDADALAEIDHFFDFADVRVAEALEDSELALEEAENDGVGERVAGDELCGEFVTGEGILDEHDNAGPAGAYRLEV